MRFGEIIYEAGDDINTVYFPKIGLVSLLATLDGESVLEVGVVSSEGLVGLSVFLGSTRSRNRALVQGEGSALSMTTADLLKECQRSPQLSESLREYAQKLLGQVSQSAICYRFHNINKRLARWLLTSADCMQSDKFRLTQEFLSHMLGVRREAVNTAARRMQDDGVINYSRGRIALLDRPRLEAAACECYSIIKEDLGN
ncbi:MAG: Crp/Fnr family transcriptional regulator [Acidobacteriota bacterium]